MKAECVGRAACGAGAKEMGEVVVDFLQAIEVEKQHRERPAGAIGALRLVFKNIEKAPVVGKAGEGIAHCQMVNLFEEPRVVNKSAAQPNDIPHNHARLATTK